MYLHEEFFFPKVLFLSWQTIYPLLAHTELLKSFALIFFLIILLHCPRAPLRAEENKWHFKPISAELLLLTESCSNRELW